MPTVHAMLCAGYLRDRAEDVPLPSGAVDADGWDEWENEYRIIRTAERHVDGFDGHRVFGSAVQYPDGYVDDGSRDPNDPPMIWIDDTQLTVNQAQEVATMILAAADEVAGWIR
jgi:hypothetical protein